MRTQRRAYQGGQDRRRRACVASARPRLDPAVPSSPPSQTGRPPLPLCPCANPCCCPTSAFAVDEPSVESHSTPSYLFRLQEPDAPRYTPCKPTLPSRPAARPEPWSRLAVPMPNPARAPTQCLKVVPFCTLHTHAMLLPCSGTNQATSQRSHKTSPFRAFRRARPVHRPSEPLHTHERSSL